MYMRQRLIFPNTWIDSTKEKPLFCVKGISRLPKSGRCPNAGTGSVRSGSPREHLRCPANFSSRFHRNWSTHSMERTREDSARHCHVSLGRDGCDRIVKRCARIVFRSGQRCFSELGFRVGNRSQKFYRETSAPRIAREVYSDPAKAT